MPKLNKKTPFLCNINITEKFTFAVHSIMSYKEHIHLKTQIDCNELTVEERMPAFANRAAFKDYVVSSKNFLGIYIDEDEKVTNMIKEGLERVQNEKDEETLKIKKEKAKLENPDRKISKKGLSKLAAAAFTSFDLAYVLTRFHLIELVTCMILSKGRASKVVDPLTTVHYLTAKFISYVKV